MLHRKDSAEAAALLRMRQFYNVRAFDVRQQGARLTVNLHAAQGMTGWMIGQHAIPARAEICDAQFIHQVFSEFVDAIAYRLGARQPDWIIQKQFGIAMLDHVRAGTRGNHNIPVCFFEDTDGMLHNRARFGAQAGIKGRLSTARLFAGKFHGHTEAAQNADDGLPCLRVERIDETRDEELDGRHDSIVILKGTNQQIGKEGSLLYFVYLYTRKVWYDSCL